MASNDERRALLEALAKDGPAGADAYRKALQQAQQAQQPAAGKRVMRTWPLSSFLLR